MRAARPRGVTDNVIREKGEARERRAPPRRGICYMPYGRRGTRYYSREGGHGRNRASFFQRGERVRGQCWARVVSFIRVKSMRALYAVRARLPRTYARTHAGRQASGQASPDPASRSRARCDAIGMRDCYQIERCAHSDASTSAVYPTNTCE